MENETKYYGVTYAKDMTLRDYFASHAMSNALSDLAKCGYHNLNDYQHECVAKFAYKVANEMMKARKE